MPDVRLPNGTIIRGVPEDATREQIMQKAIQAGLAAPEDFQQAAKQQAPKGAEETSSVPGLTNEDLANIDRQVSEFARQQEIALSPSTQSPAAQDHLKQVREKHRERLTKLEQLRKVNPAQAENIEDLSMLDNFMIGAGRGATGLGRGVMGVREPEAATQAINQAKELSPTGAMIGVGEVAGEAGPFVAASMPANLIKGLGKRVAANTALGAVEGGLVARSQGSNALAGAGIGGSVSLAAETALPILGRIFGAAYRKFTGKAPKAPLIDAQGQPTPEMDAVLKDQGYDARQFMADAQRVAASGDETAETVEEFAGVAQRVNKGKAPKQRDLDAIASQPDIDPDTLAAAERLGVADSMPLSAMSRNQQFIELEQGLTSIIGSEASRRQIASIEQINQRADDIIREMGGGFDKAGLSTRVVASAEQTRSDLAIKANDLYNQVSGSIPQNLQMSNIDPIKSYINKELREVGGDVGELSGAQRRLHRLLGEDKIVTYGLIDRTRKRIGEQLGKKSTPFPDASEHELSEMYGILTDVQGQVAERRGVGDVWKEGKQLVRQRKQLEEEMIQNFGKDQAKAIIPTLGRGINRLSKGEMRDFKRSMSAIPHEMRSEAVATALNDVFTAGSRQSQLNMGGFADWYRKLDRNTEAKEELLKHLPPGGAKRLDDLYKVSQGFQRALKNKRDTGRIQTLFNNFDKKGGMVDKLYQAGGMSDPQTSIISSIVRAVSSEKDTTAKMADKLVTSPGFRRAVLSAINNPSAKANQQAKRALTQSREYNDWLDSLPRETRANVAAAGFIPWILDEDTEDEE